MDDVEDLFDTPDNFDDHDTDFSPDPDPHHHPHHSVLNDPILDGDDFAPRDKEKRSREKRSYVVLILFSIAFVIFLLFIIKNYII